MQAHRFLVFVAALLVAACAERQGASPPLRYPTMPKGAPKSSESAAFEPASALTPLALACRSDELTPQNALDDDCDGRIDGAPAEAELVIAAAFPRAAARELVLTDDAKEQLLAPDPCAPTQSFCTARISAEALARGRKTLTLKAQEGESKDAHHPLVVSVQVKGHVATYMADVDGGTHTLGQVALP